MIRYKIILFLLIPSFILLNMANKDMFVFLGLMPHEWIILTLFIYFEIKYKLIITWVDKVFFLFYFLAIIIPLFLNYDTPTSEMFGAMLPIKTLMTYRISLKLVTKSLRYGSLIDLIHVALNIVVVTSAIAAILGILRFIDISGISNFINQTWPMQERFLDMTRSGRLASTMSGVNGTGIFFVLTVIISVYMFESTRHRIYFGGILLFVITIILTGSFTALITLAFVLFLNYKKFILSLFTVKRFLTVLVSFSVVLYIVLSITPMGNFVDNVMDRRMETQIYSERSPYKFIPFSLYGRAIRWPHQLSILKDKPLFGYGIDIPIHRIAMLTTSVNPHNYYVYVLIQGGLFGFLGYLIFKISLLKKVVNLKSSQEKKMLLSMLLAILIGCGSFPISKTLCKYEGMSQFQNKFYVV